MRDLRAFAFGAIAIGVLAYAGMAALAVATLAAGRSLAVGLGPLVFVAVERDASAGVMTFGSGLAAVAIVGGLANVASARLIRRRAGRRSDGVE